MKGKNILKEGRSFKDRRTGKMNNEQLTDTIGGIVKPNSYQASFGDALYRTSYGRNHTAKIELLDGSNYVATYNGQTKEWSGDFDKVPSGCRKAVEGFYT